MRLLGRPGPRPRARGRDAAASEWFAYPQAVTKCVPAPMFRVVAEGRAPVTRRGIDRSREQQTKTAARVDYVVAHVEGRRS